MSGFWSVGVLNLWLIGEKARTNFDCLMFLLIEQCIHDLLAVAEICAFDTGEPWRSHRTLELPRR
jgi:hypothetical protein